MRRATAAAVLLFIVSAVEATSACTSLVREVAHPAGTTGITPGPVAWSGTSLAVASTAEPGTAIWMSFFSEEGNLLASPTLAATTSIHGPLALLWNGSEFALFYAAGQILRLQRYTASGDPIGLPLAIAIPQTIRANDELAVDWSAPLDAYVIGRSVTLGRREMWATFVERDGRIRREEQLGFFAASRAQIRVAATPSGIVGIFYRRHTTDEIVFVRLDPTSFTRTNAVLEEADDLIVAVRNNQFILVRTDRSSDPVEIRWLRVDTDGQIVRPDSLLLTAPGEDVQPVALVVTDSELALTYLEAKTGFDDFVYYRLRRMTDSGAVISDSLFAAGSPTRGRAITEGGFAWTGTSFVSPAARSFESRIDFYFIRFCPLLAFIEAKRYVRPGEPIAFAAIVDGGFPSYEYEWSFGDRNFDDEPAPTHIYDDLGTYLVTLTVTDSIGLAQTVTVTVEVVEGKRRSARK